MDELVQAFSLLFTPGSELSQIVLLTLQMSAFSTVISTVIGVPLGVCVGLYRFRGKRLIMRILNTLMGLPPVLAGLIVFFILYALAQGSGGLAGRAGAVLRSVHPLNIPA